MMGGNSDQVKCFNHILDKIKSLNEHERCLIGQVVTLCKIMLVIPSTSATAERSFSQGDTCQNFDRDARPMFLGLKFGQILFFWVGKFLAIFLGFAKFPLFFWVLQNFRYFLGSSHFCVTHLNPLHEEHTVLKNIKS